MTTVCLDCAAAIDSRDIANMPIDDAELLDRVCDWFDVLPAYARADWANIFATGDTGGFGAAAACDCCGEHAPARLVPVLNATAPAAKGGTFKLVDDVVDYALEVNRAQFNELAPTLLGWLGHKNYVDYSARAMDLHGRKLRRCMKAVVYAGIGVEIDVPEKTA